MYAVVRIHLPHIMRWSNEVRLCWTDCTYDGCKSHPSHHRPLGRFFDHLAIIRFPFSNILWWAIWYWNTGNSSIHNNLYIISSCCRNIFPNRKRFWYNQRYCIPTIIINWCCHNTQFVPIRRICNTGNEWSSQFSKINEL